MQIILRNAPPSASRPAARRTLLLAGAAVAALAAQAAAQAPQGGTVAHGSATISATAAETRIRQSSDRAIIDWRSFDVGRDHRVAFDQPGAHAATLNRVNSGRESLLAGQVTAPGTIIIQNTHGVVFSGTARVDVGALVATSQTVDAGRFAADGRLVMRGGEAAGARVENQGSITVREAGLAALVGGRVANSGTIVARRGTVALASGETTTIDLAGDGVARIAVSGDTGRGDAGAENSGLIDAGGGRVVLTAGTAAGLLSTVVNTSGVIRAASADGAGGTIELVGRGAGNVRVAGNLDASGATRGGSVTVTGQEVRVAAGARVAANGRAAGGSVRIGGDRQGQGDLRRAETTTVASGARLEARATEGTGGSVILWADRETRFDGAIDVTGPFAGGFAETSAVGLVALGDAAAVEVGRHGHWLIDPVDITINAPMASGIAATLNGGGDVTVTTDLPGPQPGNLIVASPIVWNGAGNLTLFANNNLTVNNNVAITSSGAGGLDAQALRDTIIAGPVTSSGSGDIRFRTGRTMTVNHNVVASGTGAVTLLADTGNIIASNAGNDRNIAITTTSGALRLEATQGSVLIRRQPSANARNVRVQTESGPLDIVAGAAIHVLGGTGASWARVRSETGDMTLRAPDIRVIGGSGGNAFAEVVAGAGGSLTIEASRRILVQDSASPGRVLALNGADLTMRAPEQVWDGLVRAGDPAIGNGGKVAVAGRIAAGVAPLFNLGPDNNFTLEPAAAGPGAGSTASSYTSPVDLRVDTRGTGTITLNAPVTARRATLVSEERVTLAPAGTMTATGAGDALTIAAGRGFDNQAGPGALAAPGGRWLVFLDSFAGMLGSEPFTPEFDLYNRPFDYADPARGDVTAQIGTLNVLAGNRIVYGEQPVLTVTGETLAKTYGTTVMPGATLDASGLRPKDAPVGTVLVGGTASTSAGAAAGADAGTYPTTPVASLTARGAVQGYRLDLVDGTLTVNPAPLTVTANDATRLYGSPNPVFDATFAGFVLGEGPGVLGGTLGFTTAATPASPVGAYAVTPGGLTSGNYTITFVPGTLTVTPAPLTVNVDEKSRVYGQANPALTATLGGIVFPADEAAVQALLGLSTTAAPASPVGSYPIASALGVGAAAQNYTVTAVTPGTLTVTPAPLTVTANDATRPEGQPNPPFSATFSGFVLGEGPSVLGGTLGFTTPATVVSPPGTYPIVPTGLTAANYAITFVDGVLTVTPVLPPVPPAVAPQTALIGGPEPFRRGVQPFTPGDAGFRTTVLEAGPAIADPFLLTYSLGNILQLAVGEAALPGGFVPAGAARAPDRDPDAGRCGGPINLGLPAEACRTIELPESYWTTRADLFP